MGNASEQREGGLGGCHWVLGAGARGSCWVRKAQAQASPTPPHPLLSPTAWSYRRGFGGFPPKNWGGGRKIQLERQETMGFRGGGRGGIFCRSPAAKIKIPSPSQPAEGIRVE